MKYLLSIAIGPVQDFIATARRSRDLWFGSWLLSELSEVVARAIGEENLIFPSNLNGNVVNKILAIVPDIDDSFEKNLRKAIEDRLETIYKPIFKDIEERLHRNNYSGNVFKKDVAVAQIKDMYELYWAAIPYDGNNYKPCREKVEILLNARKATRDFTQVSELNSGKNSAWGSIAPKSSLDGQRESVIEDAKIDDPQIQKIFGLRKKERLCGVGVLKRLAEKGTDDSFFSTSHVASLPLLSSLKNDEETRTLVRNYVTTISSLLEIEKKDLYKYIGRVPVQLKHEVFKEYDGHLLFENRLMDLPFETQQNLDSAKTALRHFLKSAFRNNMSPLPYYALLQADGDWMGTVIDNQTNSGDHRTLSDALSGFALAVKGIVEMNRGCLIYSGGDDVLAFLPIHTVLDCARELADKFKTKLSTNPTFVDRSGNAPTLSVGIAICHHTEPLQDALATMRRAEKEAKSVKGKNALAIILSKRSGTDTTIRGSWTNDRGTGKSFGERLEWFIQLHLDDALPDGVAYELSDLWFRLRELPNQIPMRKEAVRILQRKRSNQGLNKVSKEILGKIESLIMSQEFSLEAVANEIIVARDFKNAYNQANKPAIKGEAQ